LIKTDTIECVVLTGRSCCIAVQRSSDDPRTWALPASSGICQSSAWTPRAGNRVDSRT